jgi:hypothetical protein
VAVLPRGTLNAALLSSIGTSSGGSELPFVAGGSEGASVGGELVGASVGGGFEGASVEGGLVGASVGGGFEGASVEGGFWVLVSPPWQVGCAPLKSPHPPAQQMKEAPSGA